MCDWWRWWTGRTNRACFAPPYRRSSREPLRSAPRWRGDEQTAEGQGGACDGDGRLSGGDRGWQRGSRLYYGLASHSRGCAPRRRKLQRPQARRQDGPRHGRWRMKSVKAWHFLADSGKLRDGRPAVDGEWLLHTGPAVMCESGLHASRKVTDALRYAPGSILCRVECRGVVEERADKLLCLERKILWRIDSTDVLRRFARMCALDVIDLWNAPAVVVEFLSTGETSLRDAAGDAARAAARVALDAAWVARDAAGAAAGAAAR